MVLLRKHIVLYQCICCTNVIENSKKIWRYNFKSLYIGYLRVGSVATKRYESGTVYTEKGGSPRENY